MSGANLAKVNPKVLTWALKRRGVTPEEIATKQMTAHQIKAWEERRAVPTHSQAEALANKLRIPFLLLFLSDVPDLDLEIPDLRTMSGLPETPPSIDFIQVINDCLVRQDWYRDFQAQTSASPLPFVGRFRGDWSVIGVAQDIRANLSVPQHQRQAQTWKGLLDDLVAETEDLGVLVFRSAVVGHANNKKLSVREFRGFVLSDTLAPLIFINGDDAKAAQTFTLIHELAHVWIGETGISDPHLKRRQNEFPNAKERFCNAVAAEVLVPAIDFETLWNENQSLNRNVTNLGIRFRVSSLVILIRARDLGKIDDATFNREFDAAMARFRQQDKKDLARENKTKKQGGDFWASFVIRNSARFSDAVVNATRAGRSRFTDSASLLGVTAASFERYLKRA